MSDNDSKEGANGSFQFSDFDLYLEKVAKKLKGRPKNCCINAFEGLRRALKLENLDPEMAVFRAITAEEEAATALILAIKERKYPNSEKLNFRNHNHKAGVTLFISAIENLLYRTKTPKIKAKLGKEDEFPRIDVHILSDDLGLEPGYMITPNEPLNLSITDEAKNITKFEEDLKKLSSIKGFKTIKEAIENEANLRNLLLYATEKGVPRVKEIKNELIRRKKLVVLLVSLTIIILQTKIHQLLVVQSIEAYLNALEVSYSIKPDYSTLCEPVGDIHMEVYDLGDGKREAVLINKSSFFSLENDLSLKILSNINDEYFTYKLDKF